MLARIYHQQLKRVKRRAPVETKLSKEAEAPAPECEGPLFTGALLGPGACAVRRAA